MPATFVVVPQWQGSGSARAMRLIEGATAVLGDLPSQATRVVEVPAGAGEAQGTGVHRVTALRAILENQRRELAATQGPVVTIGGDSGVELGAVQHALDVVAGGEPVAVVWFDAHADLNTPESSPSGAFHGMVARTLLGEGPAGLVPQHPLDPSRLVLAGTRSLDDAEAAFIAEKGIRSLGPAELENPAALVDALVATGATRVYLHVDLDVLDPADIDGVGYPEPFGVPVKTLLGALNAVRERFALAGAGLTEFAPRSPEAAEGDLPTILRVLSALTR